MCYHHLLALQTLLQFLVDHFCWHGIREQNFQAFGSCNIEHCSCHFFLFLIFLYCCHPCNCLIHHLCCRYFHHCCGSFLYLYSWTIFPSLSCLFQLNELTKQLQYLLCQHSSPLFSAHDPQENFTTVLFS